MKLVNQKATGNILIDECIEKIASTKRRAKPENWVQRFANISKLKHKAAKSLCRKGILKMEEDKVLLLFNRKIYPEVDPRPEKRLMDKLYTAIFGNSKEIDPNTVILISICNSTGILKHLFNKSKLKEKKNRIKEITSRNLAGEATRDAAEAMQAAVMVAAIIPAVTVATTG